MRAGCVLSRVGFPCRDGTVEQHGRERPREISGIILPIVSRFNSHIVLLSISQSSLSTKSTCPIRDAKYLLKVQG